MPTFFPRKFLTFITSKRLRSYRLWIRRSRGSNLFSVWLHKWDEIKSNESMNISSVTWIILPMAKWMKLLCLKSSCRRPFPRYFFNPWTSSRNTRTYVLAARHISDYKVNPISVFVSRFHLKTEDNWKTSSKNQWERILANYFDPMTHFVGNFFWEKTNCDINYIFVIQI